MTDWADMRCGECGIEFQVPQHFYRERRERKLGWYCPNGHSRIFNESESDKLRQERDRLKQRIAEKDDEILRAERALAAQKGQVTKLRKRAKAGVCPCCNRQFQNLKRHMDSKHPDFGTEPDLRVIDGGAV